MMNRGRVIRGRVEYRVEYRVHYQVEYRILGKYFGPIRLNSTTIRDIRLKCR